MITEKKVSLRPILESSEGIHLTVYLVNNGSLVDLKRQLRESMNEAYEWLQPVLDVPERKQFLEPLDALLNDARIFREMRGNVGIFRSKDSFRVLSVPVELERQCYVASSFHVKPLLRWMQTDREFLFLGMNEEGCHLYSGSQTSFQKIDVILLPEFFRWKDALGDYLNLKRSRKLRARREETFSWLSDWLSQVTGKSSLKLFLAGDPKLVEGLLRHAKYKNIVRQPVAPHFQEISALEACYRVRKVLKDEAKKTLERALMEFRFADEVNLANKNVFQIAKAAVRGKVSKLIVADGINIFGKIDKKTGAVVLHPFDLDHEDDDILDDLAQAVLASGGEVVVAPKEAIPKGRPALAILDHEDMGRSKELQDYELLRAKIDERKVAL